MNDYFKQTEDMFKAAQQMMVPGSFQQIMEEGLNQTRQAYAKFADMANDAGKAYEKAYESAQKTNKKITDKMLAQASENTTAAFAAAEALIQTKSLPEAAQIQAEFVKKQLEALSTQSKEIYELANKVAEETAKSLNAATAKAFNQGK